VIVTWRLAHWQDEVALRPNDLLTTFPVVLLLFLLLPPSFARWRSAPLSSERRTTNFLLAVAASFVALVVLISPFEGGVQWGPRFLLPVIVPLSVVLVDEIAWLWPQFGPARLGRVQQVGLIAVLGALLLAGAYSTFLGAQYIRNGQNGSAEYQQIIAALPERVVVTDAWFIPQGAPYTFENKIWLLAEDEKKMFQLIQNLRKQTDEPGMIYLSALTWAHIDPQVLMGPRIATNGEPHFFDWPGMYLRLARYFLYK
jgi:hypothetical protein